MADKPALNYGAMIPKLEPADTDNKPAFLTIDATRRQNVAPKNSRTEDWKIILTFAEDFGVPESWSGPEEDGAKREYIVNATGYRTLTARYGEDEDRWVGKPVVMAPTETEYNRVKYLKMHVALPAVWDKVAAAMGKRSKSKDAEVEK